MAEEQDKDTMSSEEGQKSGKRGRDFISDDKESERGASAEREEESES